MEKHQNMANHPALSKRIKIAYLFLILLFIVLFQSCREETEQIQIKPDINNGLVAFWSFDNDTNEVIRDASGNHLNGTGYSITFEKGKAGKAALFNGTGSRILFPSSDGLPPQIISNLQQGSISIWFRYQSIGAQILPLFYFGEAQTGTPHNSLIIEIGHGGGTNPGNRKLYFTVVNQSFCYDSGVQLMENTWYHFVAVVRENGNTGFLNGIEMKERNYNLGSNSNYSAFFNDVPVRELLSLGYGRYGQENPFFTFKGSIDEVRIYDRPLHATDIKELYEMVK